MLTQNLPYCVMVVYILIKDLIKVALFLSTFVNKVDKKGRVSVPSSYRACVQNEDFTGIVIYKSLINNCIEACSLERIKTLNRLIDEMEPFSEDRDALATIILGASIQLQFDTEGRVVLPQDIIDSIGISEQICFVGKGATFEMWKPEEFENYKKTTFEKVKNNKALLNLRSLSAKQGAI
jgi:MraZ protein